MILCERFYRLQRVLIEFFSSKQLWWVDLDLRVNFLGA
jgi:hypothetical protein